MHYKGYAAEFVWDVDDGVYTGCVVGIRDVVTFVAPTVRELKREFRISVDTYLDYCAEVGDEPEKPEPEQRRAAS